MSDVLESGDTKPASRRVRLVGALAVAVAVSAAVLPGVVSGTRADRERSRVQTAVRLTGGDAVGSGTRLDGTVLVAWVISNTGSLPLRLRELRLAGGGLTGTYTVSGDAPLTPGGSRQFEVEVSATSCPRAVTRAPEARLSVLAQTQGGARQRVRLDPTYSADTRRFPNNPLTDAARSACNRPAPAGAATPALLEVRVTGDRASGVLMLGPVDRTVVLRRLLPTEGLAWSTPLSLPFRVPPGDAAVRVPVLAARGNCQGVAAIAGAGTVGIELQIESADADPYVEPPQVSYVSPSDVVTSEDPLGNLRDRLCGVTRS